MGRNEKIKFTPRKEVDVRDETRGCFARIIVNIYSGMFVHIENKIEF